MNKQVKADSIEVGEGLRVSVIGGAAFVFPADRPLGEELQADVDRAAELAELGAAAAASAILGHVERQLGVTAEAHIAGVLAAEAHLSALRRSAQAEARDTSHRRAAELGRAMALPDLSDAVRLNLEAADAARVRIKLGREAKDRAIVNAALTEVRKYHDRAARLRREQLDAHWASRAGRETVDLATWRGERVDWVPVVVEEELGLVETTAMRISSRDGLASLYESQASDGSWQLTTLQYKAGRAYRLLHETAHSGLRVQDLQRGGGRRSVKDGFDLRRSPGELQKAIALGLLAKAERAVCPGLPQMNRDLIVLRSIAGEGNTLSSLSRGGNAKTANLRALRRALDTVAATLAPGACESGTT